MRKWVLNLWESQHALPGTDVYRSLALRVGQVEVCPGVEEQQCHVGVVPSEVNGDDGSIETDVDLEEPVGTNGTNEVTMDPDGDDVVSSVADWYDP